MRAWVDDPWKLARDVEVGPSVVIERFCRGYCEGPSMVAKKMCREYCQGPSVVAEKICRGYREGLDGLFMKVGPGCQVGPSVVMERFC